MNKFVSFGIFLSHFVVSLKFSNVEKVCVFARFFINNVIFDFCRFPRCKISTAQRIIQYLITVCLKQLSCQFQMKIPIFSATQLHHL